MGGRLGNKTWEDKEGGEDEQMALNAQSDNLYGKQEQSHIHSSFSDPNPALASNKVFKA